MHEIYLVKKEEKMEFFSILFKNRKLAIQLGKNDFRNRFASTSLGTVWGFLQPFVFMITYVIVFQYILDYNNYFILLGYVDTFFFFF